MHYAITNAIYKFCSRASKVLSVDFNGSASHICFFALFAETLVTRPHPDKLSMREDGELKIIDTWVLTKSKS